MILRRDFVAMLAVGACLALLHPVRLRPQAARNSDLPDLVPIGDGLVIVDGWVLRAHEGAAVLA